MRQIASLDEVGARRFVDYLIASGIPAELRPDDDSWDVWVEDDDDLDRARTELEAFQRAPDDVRYTGAVDEADAIRVAAQESDERWRKNQVNVRARLGRARRGPVTMTLVGISVVVGLLTVFGRGGEGIQDLLRIASWREAGNRIYWDGLAQIVGGQLWRLVTPIFLHFGEIHLLFNMLWLWDLGSVVELRRGRVVYLMLVLGIAICSNLGQYLVSGPTFGGMSGVVYGLLGYVWMKGRSDSRSGMVLNPMIVKFMLGWLVLCMTGLLGPVANTAHVIGLLTGMAAGSWRGLVDRLR